MWHRRISRRTVLKAGGVALALPMLDVMRPRGASAAVSAPKMVNICATLGLYTPSWLPEKTGFDYESTEYLSIIERHRERFTVFSGLSHEEQSGIQPHNSETTWLTSAKHPGMDGFRNSISIDQVAANHYGYATRFPSIGLGTSSPQSQSYTANGVMIGAQTSPSKVFADLFLQGTPEQIKEEKARLRDGGSILDHLGQKRAKLRGALGAEDNHSLDGYFEAVRVAELQLGEAAAWADQPKPIIPESQPEDPIDNSYLIGCIQGLLNLVPLMLHSGSTNVVNIMIQDHGVVPLDVPGIGFDLHNLSHHGQQAAKIDQLQIVETEIVRAFGRLLDDLHDRADGDGTLLDQTGVLFGSNLGNASSHEARHLPILVAGGGFSHGQHIASGSGNQDAALCDLYVTLLRRMGIAIESFGQSQGALTWGGSQPPAPTEPTERRWRTVRGPRATLAERARGRTLPTR